VHGYKLFHGIVVSTAGGQRFVAADQIAALHERATGAAANSYSPYSHFRVGAAVLLRHDMLNMVQQFVIFLV